MENMDFKSRDLVFNFNKNIRVFFFLVNEKFFRRKEFTSIKKGIPFKLQTNKEKEGTRLMMGKNTPRDEQIPTQQ